MLSRFNIVLYSLLTYGIYAQYTEKNSNILHLLANGYLLLYLLARFYFENIETEIQERKVKIIISQNHDGFNYDLLEYLVFFPFLIHHPLPQYRLLYHFAFCPNLS